MKKVSAIVLSLSLAFVSTNAMAWKVVFDPTAVAQIMQQYQQLQQQYQMLKKQHDSLTGGKDYSVGLKKNNIVAGSWQDVVRNQDNTFGGKQKTYDKLLTILE